MKLVGKQILLRFSLQHADVRSQIASWIAEVEEAEWRTPQDILARYHRASFIGDRRVVFDLKGNHYRLDVKISYETRVVFVKRMGTHAEYDLWKF